jgi:rhodanese-related sulfurtransferase
VGGADVGAPESGDSDAGARASTPGGPHADARAAGGDTRSTTPRTSIAALLDAARAALERLSPQEAHDAAAAGEAVLVDVRAGDHVARDGAIPGALRFPRTVLEWRLDPDCPWRDPRAPGLDARVVVVCDHGYSSSLAARDLQALGFVRATDLEGGFEAWAAAGLPVEHGSDADRT